MLEKTYQVLKQFEAQQGSVVETRTGGLIEKRPGQPQIKIQPLKTQISAVVRYEHQHKLNPINKKLEDQGIEADLDAVKENGKFKDFGEIDNVMDEGKTVLAHNKDEVLLVDVWATWCGPCQKPMKHNQEMLEKNEAVWGNNVRIIGVSVDESKDVIRERVESKKWNKVLHLTLLGWKQQHPLVSEFKIKGIPFVCLVDKWGNINYVGHPSQINLEERINELLKQESDPKDKSGGAAPGVSAKDEIQKVLQLLTKQSIQKEYKDIQLACFQYYKSDKIDNGKPTSSLEINAYIAEQDQLAEEITNKLFSKLKGVRLKLQKVKYTKIPDPEHAGCSLCGTQQLKYPLYWLKWEQGNKFACRGCVEKKSAAQGHHFSYQKNSVLLLGKWEKVAEKDLGKNLLPTDFTSVQEHQFGCNGCGGCPQGLDHARYVSLGCRSDPNFKQSGWVDLCDQCMSKLVEGNEGVINSVKGEGHLPNHPFLRVLYNVSGYYEY